MKKISPKSKIEILAVNYINNPESRAEEDKDLEIIQIEAVSPGDYIVEVQKKEGEYEPR